MTTDERNEIELVLGTQKIVVKSNKESMKELIKIVDNFVWKIAGDPDKDPTAIERAIK